MSVTDPPRDRSRAIDALRSLVRLPTVANRDRSQTDAAVFDEFLAELHARFPLLHSTLEVTRVDSHGLLARWPGASAEGPVVLMAHLDVVPVAGDAPWRHPPFSAEIDDDAIWGRGTLDDKGALVAICEAVESLLERDFTPARDVWLSFGCNEEVDGNAARAAVSELTRRGVEPWFVLDEGGAIAHDAFPGVGRPIGVVGVAEKGTTSVELRVDGRGGHASTPARRGPTARIARALDRIDRSPMRPTLPDVTIEMLERMAPHARAPLGTLLGTARRIRPVVVRALIAAGPESAAMVRTTFALTTLTGAPALNVIASSATAGVNIRVAVGDTVDEVLAHLTRAIGDKHVTVTVVERNEPSPVSPCDEAFVLLEDAITEIFPDAVPAPYVMLGASDARFFTGLCPRVYRFTPFRMTKSQRESIHSYDEHIGIDAFLDGVRWYRLLIERLPA
ncbi:MAG: peptidase [Frondihabitans sp.]|nr:peptidase [Frondihabitans sp.]